MDYREPAWQEFERSNGVYRTRDHIQKPRVSWCAFTRKWIVSPSGRRHTCNRSWKPDTAFRYWADAMDEANLIYRDRVQEQSRW